MLLKCGENVDMRLIWKKVIIGEENDDTLMNVDMVLVCIQYTYYYYIDYKESSS